MASSTHPLQQPLQTLLTRAGALALAGKGQVHNKPDGTWVTDADRGAEALLVNGLRALCPDDGIAAEEGSAHSGGCTWYIDPIDGTRSFVLDLPHWGPTIGRVDDQGPSIGATHFPCLQQHWFAARGHGAWRDGQRLPLLQDGPLRGTHPVMLPGRMGPWVRLTQPMRVGAVGSTAAHLALVCSGSADAALVGPGWSLWDVLAGLVMLAEVGGCAQTLEGAPLDPLGTFSEPFVVGTPTRIAEVRRALGL